MEIKNKITLRDINFTGRDVLNMPGVNFSWDIGDDIVSEYVFFTDKKLQDVNKSQYNGVKKVAWLLEPKGIDPGIYDWILDNYRKFDHVLTFDRTVISQIDNGLFQPYGTYWVEKNNSVKDNLVSMIASYKKEATGHKIRHSIYKHFKDRIDTFGTITGNYLDNKSIGLNNFKFSFAIENCKQDGYFTEKILDCFATKTIPIYWGTRSIGDFFNTAGIIFIDDFKSIESVLDFIGEDIYNNKLEAIEENFNKIDSYHIPELFIEKEYKHLLGTI
tara:strand:+ start:942 stop:1763 length:822 start_codon:yes stop_codon:yes gene_type:complete